MSDDDLSRTLEDLALEWGLERGRLRAVLRELHRPTSVVEIVRATGLSHRTVSRLAGTLGPWLRRSGERLALAPESATAVSRFLTGPPAPEPVELEAELSTLIARAPRPDPARDQVAATPETVLRRARLLASRLDLEGAHVVCLGDHDLTSVALARLAAGARVTVVDVDERLLAYLEAVARRARLPIAPLFADLRLGLPGPVREAADLVFTDPPYTPAGVELFATRGGPGPRRLCLGSSRALSRLRRDPARAGARRPVGAAAAASRDRGHAARLQPLPRGGSRGSEQRPLPLPADQAQPAGRPPRCRSSSAGHLHARAGGARGNPACGAAQPTRDLSLPRLPGAAPAGSDRRPLSPSGHHDRRPRGRRAPGEQPG